MASAMASAATRSIPTPYTIPLGPRIRPPRLLPGTKAANSNPQPDEPPPTTGNVWAQGKWRNPNSNAARDQREVQSVKAEKALRHATHGMNIYAYSHTRTNQVVYSLTRVMQNNKILSQLLYHGKKTVPSSLRRDMWRPYFSIHFAETPAGAEAGLKAYHQLRELSAQRQLSPPRELLIATEADVEASKKRYTPTDLKSKLESHKIKYLPIKNQLLPQRLRARKLMDQKASSVADAAYVLDLLDQGQSPAEMRDALIRARARKYQAMSTRAARRFDSIREKEAVDKTRVQASQETIEPTEGRLGLTPHAARRIALEHGGVVAAPWKGVEYAVHDPQAITQQKAATDEYLALSDAAQSLFADGQQPADFDAKIFKSKFLKDWKERHGEEAEPSAGRLKREVKLEKERVREQIAEYENERAMAVAESSEDQQKRNDDSRTVQVLWADIRDFAWASQWSSNVFHGELDQRAAVKHERLLVRQRSTIDEEGNEVADQFGKVVIQSTTTPHVFGQNNQIGWYETPGRMEEGRQKRRKDKLDEWQDTRLEKSKEVWQRFDALRARLSKLEIQKHEIQPEFEALNSFEARREITMSEQQVEATAMDSAIENLTEAEKHELRDSMKAIEDDIASNESELEEMEKTYPVLYGQFLQLRDWRERQDAYTNIVKFRAEVESLGSSFDTRNHTISERLEYIDSAASAYSQIYDACANLDEIQSLERDTIERLKGHYLEKSELEDNEAKSEHQGRIAELQDAIDTIREEAKVRRLSELETAVNQFRKHFNNTTLTDLLEKRADAERSNNVELLESVSADLKSYEDDKVLEILGFNVPEPVQAIVTEHDESMREQGIERKPPPSRGVWGRVKGLFGR